MAKKVKTRFAPSPTGFLHVGNLRNALYSYVFAKRHKGNFILRIEDTDQGRLVDGAVEHLQDILKTFGLKYDEYHVQSERLSIYKEHAEKLVKKGHAYYCFCGPDELDVMRKKQQANGEPPMYDRRCLDLKEEEIEEKIKAGESYVIRMQIPREEKIKFKDLIRGEIEFDAATVDDQIIIKSDGFPTYHLAVVVDDHLMDITHIIRGEEWISSTPKHVLLYKFLGWDLPEFAHAPLLLNPDKSKLSKRQGDVAVEDFLKKGYLPEALLNFAVLLGWHPKNDEQEIISLEEIIKEFDLKKVHKSGAVFDLEKLDWMNGQYIRTKSLDELVELAKPFLDTGEDIDKFFKVWNNNYLKSVLALEQERLKKLSDLPEMTNYFFWKFDYDKELLIWKDFAGSRIKDNLIFLEKKLSKLGESKWTKKGLEKYLLDLIKKENLTNGEVLWPMRVALSGKKASPGPFEIAAVLGKKRSLKRLNIAINK